MMHTKLTRSKERKWFLNSIDDESSDESETAEGPNGVNPQ